MIAWKYIDKQSAAIAAVRDYNNMRAIINNTPDDIKSLYDRMVSPRSSRMTGMPRVNNPRVGEDIIVKSLDKLDVMQERYRQAIEYMAWFESAWGTLTDTEQTTIREFFMTGDLRSGATARLMYKLDYSERQVFRIKETALKRLSHMLFGK